jgi:hypothetical protein
MKLQQASLFFVLLFALAACESKADGPAAAASPSNAGKPAPTTSAPAGSTPAMASLTKLPGKLPKALGQSTPEDIQKAVEAGGIKCKLKKWDRLPKETYDKYNVSWGDGPLWANIWIFIDAPEKEVNAKLKTSDAGGRPAANDGKMTLEFDIGQSNVEGPSTGEARRARDALLGK